MTKEFAPTLAPPVAPQGAVYAALPDGELLPCPCCGGEAQEYDRLNANRVSCKSCGLCLRQSKQGSGDAAARWNRRAPHVQTHPTVDDLCARIKAADDASADRDYMLDSNDCIAVLRGEWKAPLTMDKPERPSNGQAPAGAADPQLCKFYGVTTGAELIAAQARHIERLQARLPQPPSFAHQRVREG